MTKVMQILYAKIIDGVKVIKPSNQIVLDMPGNRKIYNPSEQLLLENDWVLYENDLVVKTINDETDLQQLKESLKNTINEYYESNRIKIFYINGEPVWLDSDTRASLILRNDVESHIGMTTTTIWCNGVGYEMDIVKAKELLYSVELYASKCYDNTQKHLSNVDTLESVDDVNNYNYYEGYPTPIQFNI